MQPAPLENLPDHRRERRKEERPSELIAAAMALFVEKGFAATRLDDIAARAGVSKGTLYLYFSSKEELFKAVVRSGIVSALEEAEARLATHTGSSGDFLDFVAHAWWDRILSTPAGAIPKLMLAEARNFPELADFYYEHVIKRGTALLREVVRRGIDRGEFRPIDLDAGVFLLVAPMIMLAISRHSVDLCGRLECDPQRVLAAYLDMNRAALACRPAEATDAL